MTSSRSPSRRRPRALAVSASWLAWVLLPTVVALAATAAVAAAASAPAAAPATAPATAPVPGAPPVACRLDGLPQAARCGVLRRPLDPARPGGPQIDVHYAVLPALARRPAEDPVVFFAGGPGQSAIDLAGPLAAVYARLAQRRDLVFIDQRGTGRSASLACPQDAPERAAQRTLAEDTDPAGRLQRVADCRRALQALPHGDLRFYTTALAVADIDAVRAALGAAQINAIGASYGTRMVLEYARQFPQRLRRGVLDGVAPPDMRLTESVAADNQAAWDALLAACSAEPACARRHPQLRAQWQQLLASLPASISLPHPVSGQPQALRLDRDTVLGLVRAPLYQPALAAGLPAAVAEAAQGRWAPLLALGSSLGGGRQARLAMGQHLSVVCSEDVPPRPAAQPLSAGAAQPLPTGAAPAAPAPDFGDSFARFYQQACADWPRGTPPAGFYGIPPAPAPMWLLSGGADPVTPPRHAQRVMAALGARARHTVVPQAGHGVASLPCLRDAVQRYLSAPDDAAAQAVADGAGCAAGLPRPPAFQPPGGPPTTGQVPSPQEAAR